MPRAKARYKDICVQTTFVAEASDVVSFNTVMQAWANAAKVDSNSAPERAEEILKLLQASAKDDDPAKRIYPDEQSYVAVMNAYAVARRNDSIYHTRRLLNDLVREGAEQYLENDKKISAVPFTVMLKAVAKSDPSRGDENPAELQEDPFGVKFPCGSETAYYDSWRNNITTIALHVQLSLAQTP